MLRLRSRRALLLGLLLLVFQVSPLAAEVLNEQQQQWVSDQPKIKVGGGLDWLPFDYADSQGEHQGLSAAYLKLIADKTGLQFDVTVEDWYPRLNQIRMAQLDLLPAVFRDEETLVDSRFSLPYLTLFDHIFVSKKANVTSLADLRGLTVAMPTDFARRQFIQDNFPGMKIINAQSMSDSIGLVMAGQADVLLGSFDRISLVLERNRIQSIVPLAAVGDGVTNQGYMAVANHQAELLPIINQAINAITPAEHELVLQNWLMQQPLLQATIEMTAAEQQWFADNPVVYFGADKQWPPFEFRNNEGVLDGISADYLDLIELYSGLEIQVEIDTWHEILNAVKEQQLQGLGSVVNTEERQSFLSFTDPYLSVPIAVYIRDEAPAINDINDLKGRKVALNRGSYLHEWLVEQYPEIELLLTDSNKSAVEAVSFGQADAYVGNVAVADYVIKSSLLSNLRVVLQLQEYQTAVSLGVRKDLPELFSIINKSLAMITAEQHQAIRKKWVEQEFDQVNLLPAERGLLANLSTLSFKIGGLGLPLEGLDAEDNYTGINADFIERMDQMLPIDMQFLAANTDLPFDLTFSYANDPQYADAYVGLPAHLSSDVVVVMPAEARFVRDLNQIRNLNIGMLRDAPYINTIKSEFPGLQITSLDDIDKAFDAMNNEQIEALLLPFVEARYHINNRSIGHLKIVGKTRFKVDYSLYVTSTHQALPGIIEKTLALISSDDKAQIMDSWLALDVVEKSNYGLALAVALVSSGVLFVIVFWNRRMHAEIQARVATEQALAAEKENFEIMFEQSGDANLIFQNGEIVACNHKVVEMFGLQSKAELLGSDFEQWLPTQQIDGEDSVEFMKKMVAQSLHNVNQRFECQIKRKNGDTFWADAIFTRIKHNNTSALYVVWRDISQQKEMATRLMETTKQAKEANQAKSLFLANMSHEIRTPMNAIIGFTELLDEQLNEPHLKSYVKTIRSAGDTLLMLINDILDLSKIEAGKIESQQLTFHPHEYFEDIAQIFSINMQKKGLQLVLDIDESVPHTLCLDINHLRQVLFNLLGNAIKFSEHGQIHLRVKSFNQRGDETDLLIEVEDQGIGIPAADHEHIFEAFEQQKNQDRNKYSGTGLGLAISKKLIQSMGGDITVRSQVGKGACFSITIPRVNQSAQVIDYSRQELATHPAQHYVFHKAVVLVVDDNYHNRALIAEYFSDTEVTSLHAENGLDAINCVEKHRVDLVLMDIRMPVMDGYESANRIKAQHPKLPIIALTASVLKEDHERIESGDFDGFLPKPVIKSRLFETVCQFLPHTLIDSPEQTAMVPQKLTDEEFKLLPKLIKHMAGPVTKAWEMAMATQSMKDIKAFVVLLKDCGHIILIERVNKYADELLQQVEAFDVMAIQNSLGEFKNLKNHVKALEEEF